MIQRLIVPFYGWYYREYNVIRVFEVTGHYRSSVKCFTSSSLDLFMDDDKVDVTAHDRTCAFNILSKINKT